MVTDSTFGPIATVVHHAGAGVRDRISARWESACGSEFLLAVGASASRPELPSTRLWSKKRRDRLRKSPANIQVGH